MKPENRLNECEKQAAIAAESLTGENRADAEALAEAAAWLAGRVEG